MRNSIFLLLLSVTTALSIERGVQSDVKYIRCETCLHISRNAVTLLQEESTPKSQLQIYDTVESMCSPKTKEGRWLKKIDLVERLGKLRLIAQDGQQDCKQECKTIALACEDVMDGIETELADHLYAQHKKGTLTATEIETFLCAKRKGLSSACSKSPPRLPRDRPAGPSFEPKAEKDVNMDNLMDQLREANGGDDINMNMFGRSQLQSGMNPMGQGADQRDDDDDDDDEEDERDNLDLSSTVGEGSEKSDLGSVDDVSLGDANAGLQFEEQPATVRGSKSAGVDTASDEL